MKPLTPTTPHVIFMVGIPGAGKSHFAEHFSKTFGAPYINHHIISDLVDSHEMTISKVAAHMLDELLKTHRTIIFEGPTHSKAARLALFTKIKKAGYLPLLVWVQTETTEAKRRATKKGSRYDSDSYDTALQRFQPPQKTESPVVISGKHTYPTQVKIVLKHLANPRESHSPATPPPRTHTSRSITVR